MEAVDLDHSFLSPTPEQRQESKLHPFVLGLQFYFSIQLESLILALYKVYEKELHVAFS